MILPVILCGGSGSRLWPMSRKALPKQFLALSGSGFTMLQDTVKRLPSSVNVRPPVIICSYDHRFLVAQQMLDIGVEPSAIILEPEGKNTAAAAILAALVAEEDTVVLLPADHVVADIVAFHASVERVVAGAREGFIATFGVAPTAPETGYGYIQANDVDVAGGSAKEIKRFVEKPDLATAQSYLDSGDYYWNSGMFAYKGETLLAEAEQQVPAILDTCKKSLDGASKDLNFTLLNAESFAECPSDSIDYAIMENASKRCVVEFDAGWSDIGSWVGIKELKQADNDGNVFDAKVVAENTTNSYVHSSGRLVATIGIDNLSIIDTPDALLVANNDSIQSVKTIVERLVGDGVDEAVYQKVVYRPWGSYESICESDRFQVKQIIVNPGQKLSLQMHHHRAEHWIVVQGIAEVTCDDKVFRLSEDQSTYIPIGSKHRLVNPGKIPLKLIEVQSGSYLGEDDIVRFDDVYGRGDS